MSNTAKDIIIPKTPGIFRTIFLYTGQGESTLMVIPDGANYKYILVDCDQDHEPYEIDIAKMLKDLFDNGQSLDVYINTHPHKDHLGGIKEIYDAVSIDEVWHSNHKPGADKHKGPYADFLTVLKAVGDDNTYLLKGTNTPNKIRKKDDSEILKKLGDVDYIVLSPAEYLCEDIEEKDADERDRRIHEQCAVVKFSYGNPVKSVMITGDSDKTAWKDHITSYHKAKLPADVLSGSHHGSRTFFKDTEDDEDIYEDHIKEIKPTYLIISAPAQEDSPHDHPHDDAMELYKKYVDDEDIFHLGQDSQKYCVIVDISKDGNIDVQIDYDLVEEYGQKPEDDPDGEEEKESVNIAVKTSRIDNKPMG
jgi:competence protein ComEC